ncbi:type II toxin-antitoxin system RelE/ParE family toxin [Mesorhizobium captivum]|uniref:Type II toxin-antitoxin system RelE/ParE family toxin n=1 Tax=Mesorhizobium captivum TaxID=3072319 RepID=A0ABU4Z9C9_9HYPH|nr:MULTISPECIES: type II toxin-antitoxin system RelE/ParE family toxin [unclassified Mesorhizobium]MDX8448322.1 type II toxin-antitoxin system RelE/ParE family toxin [Mesorhizobium sp. VK3C]MDX8495851.1 type II toxin-antitoxin system RelE/ParE family toxin [Mesorhizobium sp. VK22B]MDX8510048.1 type II toxin-antitoxin system RelE/ParE family toxin [Mesorhizobium sp. VK22E]
MAGLPIIRSPAVENDLTDIWLSIAKDSPRAADHFLDAITERILQLAVFPESGPRRPDIGADTRALTISNYLILYRHAEERIEVVRIVHGARDLSTLL